MVSQPETVAVYIFIILIFITRSTSQLEGSFTNMNRPRFKAKIVHTSYQLASRLPLQSRNFHTSSHKLERFRSKPGGRVEEVIDAAQSLAQKAQMRMDHSLLWRANGAKQPGDLRSADKLERRINPLLLPLRLIALLLRIILLPLRILLAPLIVILRALIELLRVLLLLINPLFYIYLLLVALNVAANVARIVRLILRIIFRRIRRKRKDEREERAIITLDAGQQTVQQQPVVERAKHKRHNKGSELSGGSGSKLELSEVQRQIFESLVANGITPWRAETRPVRTEHQPMGEDFCELFAECWRSTHILNLGSDFRSELS